MLAGIVLVDAVVNNLFEAIQLRSRAIRISLLMTNQVHE
jgi:hypothetical protein